MNEVYEDQLIQSVVWWLPRLGIAACATILVLTAALAVLAFRPRVPPYVIALDHGRIVGYAAVFAGTGELGNQVIENQLREFIYDSRVITANRDFEQRNIHTAYAIARAQASRALDAYYQASPDNDPIQRGYKGDWRDIRIVRCLREPAPDTWRVEWQETTHPHMGSPITANWEATMRVFVGPPDSSNELNPLGVYIISLDMQAESK